MITGALAAALPRDHPNRSDVLQFGWELFLGWRVRDCERICTCSLSLVAVSVKSSNLFGCAHNVLCCCRKCAATRGDLRTQDISSVSMPTWAAKSSSSVEHRLGVVTTTLGIHHHRHRTALWVKSSRLRRHIRPLPTRARQPSACHRGGGSQTLPIPGMVMQQAIHIKRRATDPHLMVIKTASLALFCSRSVQLRRRCLAARMMLNFPVTALSSFGRINPAGWDTHTVLTSPSTCIAHELTAKPLLLKRCCVPVLRRLSFSSTRRRTAAVWGTVAWLLGQRLITPNHCGCSRSALAAGPSAPDGIVSVRRIWHPVTTVRSRIS